MKKLVILSFLLLLMQLPTIVNAEKCDLDKISINSISVENKSDSVEEINKATVSGKNININLSMSELGANIKYKLVVKNESNAAYQISKDSLNINSDFIDYILESEDNSYIVKANSSKTIYLIIEYKNEVPDDIFEYGIYNDKKNMTFNLSTGETREYSNTSKNKTQ